MATRNFYSRAIALNLGKYAGDPGGVSVRNRASSLTPFNVFTVMVCRKSSGKDICPGSRFNDYATKKRGKKTRCK